jgi:hypothetical protein
MTSYVLLITLFLTEGGTLEAEEDTSLTSRQECVQEAARQEKALRREFAITKEERGICPFRDVKIRCEKAASAR